MNRKSWGFLLSALLTLASLPSLVCDRGGEGALASAAKLKAEPTPAAYDRLIQSADTPELREFAAQAKVGADSAKDLDAILPEK